MSILKNILLFLCVCLLISCQPSKNKAFKQLNHDAFKNQNKITIQIARYEKALFGLDPNDPAKGLKSIQKEFFIFLNSNLNDPVNILQIKNFINDPMLIRINKETQEKFPDLTFIEKQLSDAFSNFHHYFPDKKIPKVYSYINFLNDKQPIIYSDSVLIIELDMYLGKNSSFYPMANIPAYVTNRCSKEYMVADCMKEIGRTMSVNNSNDLTFLNQIIATGKILFFLDAMLPETPDSIKIGYTPKQIEWCMKNEENIWKFFIDQKLLYQTEPSVISKFLNDAPFTPGLSHESPGRMGCWIGWQIVRDFMQKNEQITIAELLKETDAQKILKLSRYKPKK